MKLVKNREYDDPYLVLAMTLFGRMSHSQLRKLLTDDSQILNMVVKEVKEQDYRGCFLDCIIEDILEHGERVQYMGQLAKLGEYYFQNLDLPRLRVQLIKFADELGTPLEE